MDKDLLRNTLTTIEKWCTDNDIVIFYGHINENVLTEISWTRTDDKDWEKYLLVVKKTKTQLLVITVVINDIATDNEDIINYQETLEEEVLLEFTNALQEVKRTKGYVAYFNMNFIFDNVCYGYSQYSEWVKDFAIIQETFADDGENEESQLAKTERLSEDRIDEFVEKITSNEKYLSSKNLAQRSEIVFNLLKLEGITDPTDLWTIKRRVDTIYDEKIKPDQEEKIKQQILELKSKGVKKVEIASKLNITKGMVDKFYYKEN